MTAYSHYCLFGEPWWLDIVSGPGGWEEVRVEGDGKLVARLPFVIRKSKGITSIGMPRYTQTLGPYFQLDDCKQAKLLARQKDLADELISRLPKHNVFRQSFHHEVEYLLPWHWRGFKNRVKYSYVIDDLTDEKRLWECLQSNIRSDIRKARNRYELCVRDDLGLRAFLDVCNETYRRQGKAGLIPSLATKVIDKVSQLGRGRLLFAVDAKGRIHAGVFLVWDQRTTYYLFGGGDPALRTSGAHSLLIWESIKHAAGNSQSFDFEGSMIESVERFFRAFGARQMAYTEVWKTQGRFVTALHHLREAARALRP